MAENGLGPIATFIQLVTRTFLLNLC